MVADGACSPGGGAPGHARQTGRKRARCL